MIKAVIFDHDGVLVNSPAITWTERKKYLQEKYEINLAAEDVQAVLGLSQEEQATFLGKKFHVTIDFDDYAQHRHLLESVLEKQLKVLPGAKELIEDLMKKEIKVAIASSKPRRLILRELQRLKLNTYFDIVLAKEDVAKTKPDPEVFLLAAQKLGVNPEECAVIEDAIHGIVAAKKSGMAAIGVCSPFCSEFPGADLKVHSLTELSADKIIELR